MSKYNTLWAYIHENGESQLTLTFDEIGQIVKVQYIGNTKAKKRALCCAGRGAAINAGLRC